MSRLSNTNHEIYQRRGKMNLQIGAVLLVFVLLVMVATIAKLSAGQTIGAPSSPVQLQNEIERSEANQ